HALLVDREHPVDQQPRRPGNPAWLPLPGTLLQFAAGCRCRPDDRSAKIPHAAAHRRAARDATEDDEVHDDRVRRHVLSSGVRSLRLLHRQQRLGPLLAPVPPAQGQTCGGRADDWPFRQVLNRHGRRQTTAGRVQENQLQKRRSQWPLQEGQGDVGRTAEASKEKIAKKRGSATRETAVNRRLPVGVVALFLAALLANAQKQSPLYRIEKEQVQQEGKSRDRVRIFRETDNGKSTLFVTVQFLITRDGQPAYDVQPDEIVVKEDGRQIKE